MLPRVLFGGLLVVWSIAGSVGFGQQDGVGTGRGTPPPPRTPEEERRGFSLPEGFEVELVAAESEGIGKFVTAVFDASGRLWTMTALEYPVDANENPELSARLFAGGGRDKVLVFDQPYGERVSRPRVFVEGLVMPLGILPYKDGVYVQYGREIRFYRDTDGDGKADTHEVVLTGFGTQDSHLFPHQFTRAPGGWILAAQGLFNTSTVRRPGGKPFGSGVESILWRHCKLARFTLDGSDFELLTAGPNNIWGLTVSREGRTWLQEANDLGYPIIPYEPGGYYQTGSRDRLKTYQPLMPPTLSPPQMGGTGLSGLALADDLDGWPAPWGMKDAAADSPRTFYVANPITSRIQIIHAIADGKRFRYEKGPDFLLSQDPYFRPVSVQFGLDGCLYVTDWYNKIISHNEVPRDHPERDKVRGRIWRIRHTSQHRSVPPSLSKIPDSELPTYLGAPNARIAALAWQEIVDRRAIELIPVLERYVGNTRLSVGSRLGALWALEGISHVATELLVVLSADASADIRHEAIRIAAAQPRSSTEFLAVAKGLVDDPAPRVRAALGDALRRVSSPDGNVIELMVRLGGSPVSGSGWDRYDREFERFLARWAMELNSTGIKRFLNSDRSRAMPLENRVLATLALPGRDAAVELTRLIPQLTRSLAAEEIRVLASHFNEPEVAGAMRELLGAAASRGATLRTLLALRTQLDMGRLKPAIAAAAQIQWREADSDGDRESALRVAGAFRLASLDESIVEFAARSETSERMKLAALRALRELGSTKFERLAAIAADRTESDAVRSAALAALAESPAAGAASAIVEMLEELSYQRRRLVVERMSTSRHGALALLTAVRDGDLEADSLSPAVLQTMREVLPDNEELEELYSDVVGDLSRVVRLCGGPNDFVQQSISLTGPFTVETWIRLNSGIGNADGILGRPGVFDMNFYRSVFRVWIGGLGDVVTAGRKVDPGAWTHVAVTRDDRGKFRVYINGEFSAESRRSYGGALRDLNIGRTTPASAGTDGCLLEYRVWNVTRTAAEIRDNFDRRFGGEDRPAELVFYSDGSNWGKLSGRARVEPILDPPRLLGGDEAKQRSELFVKYRRLAMEPGDQAAGKILFTKTCLVCHQEGGVGGKIGPPLDGVGLTGTEALLRNILTPSAAMEGGYRNYRVLTTSGRVFQGLLVAEDDRVVILRLPDTADQRIEKSAIERAGFTSTSVMPSGLLEQMTAADVRNLFAYLHSLRQKTR